MAGMVRMFTEKLAKSVRAQTGSFDITHNVERLTFDISMSEQNQSSLS